MPKRLRVGRPEVWLCAAVAAFVAALGVIGADALWLVPLGEQVAHGHLPSSIPYATAPTSGWHDVPAGGELVFWAAYHAFGGDRGLVVLQVLAAAVGIGALARGLRRESPGGSALAASLVVVAGALPAVAVTNFSLFSLALFPLLLGLLEAESVVRTPRIWLAVPLVALWGNLHGGVLVGLGLLACYLVLDRARRRPVESILVLVAGGAALFANPVLWHTPAYYAAVFHNETARRGDGLWAPLGAGGFDLLLVAAAVVLAGAVLWRRSIRLCEAVAVVGLAAATVHVARNGTWLLFVLAYPAARGIRLHAPRRAVLVLAAVPLAVAATASLVRTPRDPGSRSLSRAAAARGGTVLAEPLLGQQVVLVGGEVWVDNPIDAFRRADQRLYVDWSSGSLQGRSALAHASLVLVRRNSAAGRLASSDERLTLLSRDRGAALYAVRRRGSGG